MTWRSGAVLVALIATMSLVSFSGAGVPEKKLSKADLPPYWKMAGDESKTVVGWVFGAGNLLTCESMAREIRRLQNEVGSQVRISAVAVDTDSVLATSFLRKERVDADLVRIGSSEYRAAFGSAPIPRLYVIRGGTVIASLPASAPVPGQPGPAQELRAAVLASP